jgi:hypothetical protein
MITLIQFTRDNRKTPEIIRAKLTHRPIHIEKTRIPKLNSVSFVEPVFSLVGMVVGQRIPNLLSKRRLQPAQLQVRSLRVFEQEKSGKARL